MSREILKISKDGESPAALGDLSPCCTTLRVNNFFPVVQLEAPLLHLITGVSLLCSSDGSLLLLSVAPFPPYLIAVPMLLWVKRSSCICLQGQSFLKANQQMVEDVEPLQQCRSGKRGWLESCVNFTCCNGLLQLSPEWCSILYQAGAE